jgi:hypothetical protein
MSGEAPAIQQLRTDANTAWPKRNKSWDGTWGDTAHQARKSDHNTGDAMDVTHDPASGADGNVVAAYAIRDPRVKYVIWNRRIYDTRNPGAGWQPYSKWKSMPHDHHVHISVKQAARADTSPWAFNTVGPPPPIDVPGEAKFEDADPKVIEERRIAEEKAKAAAAAAEKKARADAAAAKRRQRVAPSQQRRRVSDATSKGIHIFDGENSVVLGSKQWMAAHVESPHTGGGQIAKGSSTVFVGKRQLAFARKDDVATDRLFVKEGQPNVLIGIA